MWQNPCSLCYMAVTNECCNSTARPGYPYPFANWSPAAQPYLPRRLMLVTTGCRLYRRDRQHRAYMGRISGERPGPTGICAARPAERPHRAAPPEIAAPPSDCIAPWPPLGPVPSPLGLPSVPIPGRPPSGFLVGLPRRGFLVGTFSSGLPRRALLVGPCRETPCRSSRAVDLVPSHPGPSHPGRS